VKESTDRNYNVFSRRFWFGQIDLRPLGLMRIVFGSVLLFSVLDLAPILLTFVSDDGVMPRGTLLTSVVRPNRICVFDFAGPSWVVIALYVLMLMSIVAFTVGWHSRIATFASFVLLAGINERNLMLFDGSDSALRVMLFWLVFMPVGARYSVDALLRARRGEPTRTHGPALPIRMGQLQIAWVYADTTFCKWPGHQWHDGTALRLALALRHLFVRDLGAWMFHRPLLVSVATRGTVVIESLFLPLVFLPLWRPKSGILSRLPEWLCQPSWKARALILGAGMHVGIALLMSVGNFSYIMMSTYPLLFEPEWVEPIVQFFQRQRAWQAARALVERIPRRVKDALEPPGAPSRAEALASLLPARLRRASTSLLHVIVLPGLMFLVMWFSLPEPTGIPPLVMKGRAVLPEIDVSPSRMWVPLFHMIQEIDLWQKWDMFSPYPMDHDTFIMGRGQLTDGSQVDVLRGDRGNGGPLVPPIDPGWFFNRWTKYISNILYEPAGSENLLELGRFVCRRWNTDIPAGRAALSTFKLYREDHRTPMFGERDYDWEETMIWDHTCFEQNGTEANGTDASE
jgi:hypothetical protein